jgi:hypothetical protein
MKFERKTLVKFTRSAAIGLLAVGLVRCGFNKDSSSGPSAASVTSTRVQQPTMVVGPQYLDLLSTSLNYNIKTNGTILTEFGNYRASLPQFGDATLSSSMSRTYTNFAYRACGSAFTQERNSGQPAVVFRFIDYSKAPGAQGAARVDAFLKHQVYRLWGRTATDGELGILRKLYTDLSGTVADSTSGTAELIPYLCTVIASAPQAYLKSF